MNSSAIGLDIGGTKMLGAVVSAAGEVITRIVEPTPTDADEVVTTLVDLALALQRQAPEGVSVGVGYPALITRDGIARYGPNISTRELRIRQVLTDALHTDVTVDNDATCATWAEYRVGAGAGAGTGAVDDMVMFTLGTGIGGGLVVGGQVVRGANGFAGELGHMVVAAGGRPGKSGIRGEIEAYSSGSAFVSLIAEAVDAGAFVGTSLDGPETPTPAEVEAAAANGLAPATEIVQLMGWHLGVAMASAVNILDPALIVVGGGAAKGGDLILDPARAALRAHTLGADHRPAVPVVPAVLGPDAGVIGAALLASSMTG